MNILNKLTIKNLQLNIKRTIVTIIGIILSTALICAVAGMFTSLQATLINDAKKQYGNRHVTILNVQEKDIPYFVNNRQVASYYLSYNLGYAKITSENSLKPYLFIQEYTETGFKENGFQITKGRMPLNEEEIVLNEGLSNYKIGDKLTLEVGKRVLEEYPNDYLGQNNPVEKDNPETIVEATPKTFTVVGFVQNKNDSITSPGYTALTITDKFPTKTNLNVFLLFKNPKYYQEFQKLLDTNFSEYSYNFNNDLLRWQMVKVSSGTLNSIIAILSIVIGIIIVSSVFVIRNSFNISITEKKKQYGMLASLGATKKQIKKNVLYEGFILGLIGIPLGILSGIFADFILVKVINILLKDSLNGIVFAFKVPYLAIIFATCLAGLTIYFSVIKAALKSAKISPIEAIRSNDEIKIKAKKLKAPKIIGKLWGVGGLIAYKNLQRSKSKYRTTVVSLVVSIAIFISLSTLITYGFKMSSMYYNDYNYNIVINKRVSSAISSNDWLKIYDELLELTHLGFVDAYSIPKNIDFYLSAKYLVNSSHDIDDEDHTVYLDIVSLNEEEYNRFIKELGGKKDDYEKGGILIDDYKYYDGTKYVLGHSYNIQDHEVITGKLESRDSNVDLEIEVVKKTDIRPMGFENSNNLLVVSETYLENLNMPYTCNTLYIKTSNHEAYAKALDKYIDTYPDKKLIYTDIDAMVKQEKSMIILIAIFLYGFIIVISLIGITNIFNTITTNMNLRQKEFAMLKSIGMTKKEFNHMIRLESIMYGMKSLIIGIPLGCLGSYLLYKGFQINAEMPFVLPYLAIILTIIIVTCLISLIMHYSFKKINKQNIIETIRKDNI